MSDHIPVFIVRKRVKGGADVTADFMGRTYRRYLKDEMIRHMKNLNWDLFFTCIDVMCIDHLVNYLDERRPIKRNIFKRGKTFLDYTRSCSLNER